MYRMRESVKEVVSWSPKIMTLCMHGCDADVSFACLSQQGRGRKWLERMKGTEKTVGLFGWG